MGSGFRCATRSEAGPLVAIGRVVFTMAFGRDLDYHDTVTQLTWLDRRTGDVLQLYETDGDAYAWAG